MANKKLIDMTEAFTTEGIGRLRTKTREKYKPVLKFEYEGSPAYYRIEKVTKDGRVMGRQVNMLRPDELKVVDSRRKQDEFTNV
jgi:hypothetical protein